MSDFSVPITKSVSNDTTLVFDDDYTGETIRWTVRLRRRGDHWGREHKLEHNGPPVVEFYDGRHVTDFFTQQNGGNAWGQFVADYYVDTLATHPRPHALDLHMGVDSWKIGAAGMELVFGWLDELEPLPSPS
jgi:hypothetical protein